ncbi:nucleoside diphosphate-linked moiety X motif 8 isoform X1 [Platichthys flesus]|uniref:nucleoside diphosphate-linked moiety X motif 8 isoform X1 n=2 Tax=Platichthys flesus TaxID=8260 RepID=UPI002DBAA7C8|nr:nucleoside diphosphate-linked moiety X motif 8 isoform X1 [Platichthys flesus]
MLTLHRRANHSSSICWMFRAPQILTWSCPTRSWLLLRAYPLAALSEHTGAVCQRARHVSGNRCEGIPGGVRSEEGLSSLSKETVSNSIQPRVFNWEGDNHHLREVSYHDSVAKTIVSSRHQTSQLSTSTKPVPDSWKSTVLNVSGQNPQAVSPHQGCLTNTRCLLPWRRPLDFFHVSLSFTNKAQCNPHSHIYHRRHVASLSALTSQILNHFHRRSRATSHFLQQSHGIHQASPHLVDDWRDCLSPENENRCRQSLRANLKLYDTARWSKAASQSKGEKQLKYASVLVTLCTVEGQPSFLFTLRSLKLGRNKGDVSFAGGKSDPSDRDVVATALRETWEELGVNVAADRVWGVLKPLRDNTGMMIVPVLANLGPVEELSFKPNPEEVEEIFTLPLSHLCNPRNCGYTHFRSGDKYGYTLPVFQNDKKRVWGLTAIALDQTLKMIVPP